MFVITDRTGIAFCVSETLDHQDNGNPLVYNGSLAIAESLVGHEYPNVKSIPSDYADGKYFFNGTDWELNPNFSDHNAESSEQEIRLSDLEDAVMALSELMFSLM